VAWRTPGDCTPLPRGAKPPGLRLGAAPPFRLRRRPPRPLTSRCPYPPTTLAGPHGAALAAFRAIDSPIQRYLYLRELRDGAPGDYYWLLIHRTEEARVCAAHRRCRHRVMCVLRRPLLRQRRGAPLLAISAP